MPCVAVEIGFEQVFYSVNENDPNGFALIRVRIIRGVLRIPLTVNFMLSDGTAIGE